jgi:hypothetical protein
MKMRSLCDDGPFDDVADGETRVEGMERKELRRISYLAGIRNQVMDKVRYLAERMDGQGKRSFDKVLWLNDVIFTVSLLRLHG